VTVKLRTSRRPDDHAGVEAARRLAWEAGVAGLALHPRSAVQRHKGTPDYALVRELVEELPVPVIVSGGLSDAGASRRAWEETGADALMLARGSLGNPWLFARLLGSRAAEPTRDEVLDELDWVVDRAVEHLGEQRAARYLRKFYPWYVERLGAGREVQDALQRADSLEQARAVLAELRLPRAA
jgi:tRNA-dihydrouridine synthase